MVVGCTCVVLLVVSELHLGRCTCVLLGLQVLQQGLADVDSGLHPQQLGGVVWKQREQLLGTRTYLLIFYEDDYTSCSGQYLNITSSYHLLIHSIRVKRRTL